MMKQPRVVLASGSVSIITVVVVVAAALGPNETQPWLLFCGVAALVAAVQSATSDPADVAYALLLSLPPVIALVAEGSPTWLVGPFGALLLVAGELNALSWACEGAGPMSARNRRRLLSTGQISSLGLAASLVVGAVAPGPWPGGTAAALSAATAVAMVGLIVFRPGT